MNGEQLVLVCNDDSDCNFGNGTCMPFGGTYGAYCDCNDQWKGEFCQEDVDECELDACTGAPSNCSNTIGSYNCSCIEPYQLNATDTSDCVGE